MPVYNSHVDAVMLELERFGLKGQLSDRGKHQEIRWQYNDGRSRFTIVPNSPSDGSRGALNARGQVRRQLRLDAVQPPSATVRLIQKAFSLPSPQDHGAYRLARLESDFEGLLDELIDTRAQLADVLAKLTNMRVTVSFGPPSEAKAVASVEEALQAPRAAVSKVVKERRGGARMKTVLRVLGAGGWVAAGEIARQAVLPLKNTYAALHYLKKTNRVEVGRKGQYRIIPQENAVLDEASTSLKGNGYAGS